jgi:flagellar biosynthesis GTPase FlhF
MTTEFRTFRAPNMQAALDIVRQEMGHDAVIVETRHLETRRLFFFGKRFVRPVRPRIRAPRRP